MQRNSFEIESATPHQGRLEIWELEYGSYASVLSFCSRVTEMDRVDNIILNPAVASRNYDAPEQHNGILLSMSSALLFLQLC